MMPETDFDKIKANLYVKSSCSHKLANSVLTEPHNMRSEALLIAAMSNVNCKPEYISTQINRFREHHSNNGLFAPHMVSMIVNEMLNLVNSGFLEFDLDYEGLAKAENDAAKFIEVAYEGQLRND